jgi:hypothetical protein
MDEQRVVRMLIIGAAVVFAVVIGLVGFVVFQSTYQAPRQVIAEIGDTEITLHDVLPQTRLDALQSGQVTVSGSINDYARNLIFKERGALLGASVSSEDIDARIIESFGLRNEQGELPDELTDAGRTAMENFLDIANVSEQDYRDWLEGQLIQVEIGNTIEDQVPDSAPHVFVNWIITESIVDTEAALARIDTGESFGDVAADFNLEDLFSDGRGSVGWVPEDAFDEIDAVLFRDTLVVNEVMGPLVTSLGSMLIKVTGGPLEQPVSVPMRLMVGQTRFQLWLDEQTDDLVTSLAVTNENGQWILDHL